MIAKPSREEVDNARWGASYGRKRHLVDHESVRNTNRGLIVTARCNANVILDFLDTVDRPPIPGGPTGRERVAGLEPCGNCYGIAVVDGISLSLREEH